MQQVKFERRDIPFSDASGIVKDILADVCLNCDLVILILSESIPVIGKAYLETCEE